MNEYEQSDYDNDVEIDLVDLIFYFLKKWKILLIAVIIGALLGGVFYALRTMRDQSSVVSSEAKTEKDYDIADEVLDNMEAAHQFRLQYLRQKEYNENSVLMSLDPNAFYTGTLKYYIPAGENTQEIGMLYKDLLDQYEFYEDLAMAVGSEPKDSAYLREVVDVLEESEYPILTDIKSEDMETEIIAETEETESEGEEGSTGLIYSGRMITYTVIATDERSCEQMLEVIRKKVNALAKSCELQYGDYKASELGEAVQLVSDGSYLLDQKTNADQMNTNLSNAVKLETAFSDEELEYYNKVFWNDEDIETDEISSETALIGDEKPEESMQNEFSASIVNISRRSLMKWIILGIFVGVMIWGFCYLVIYLMDSSVKTVNELRDSYHLPLLGHVSADEDNKKSWVDKLYARIKGSPDTIPYIVSEIDTMEKGPVALCGDKEYSDVQTVMVELAENCSDVSANDFASKNIEALKKVKDAGSEILVVRIGKTKRAEIRRELEVCRMQNVKVAGIIAVENA